MIMHIIKDGEGRVRGTVLLDQRPNDETPALVVQLRAALRSESWSLVPGAVMPAEPYQGHMSPERKAQMMAEFGAGPPRMSESQQRHADDLADIAATQ